eukprot:TRINITY_DN21749_c0_g1_i1.p1 TRINITY_DN21749_c0_g1~~TRINITY_DN21749_c0_g1_i1.p1  ORF type:complete len:343 (+),score=37.75 TRINITY_DN21749_c0_g1_i1:71-1099(+)
MASLSKNRFVFVCMPRILMICMFLLCVSFIGIVLQLATRDCVLTSQAKLHGAPSARRDNWTAGVAPLSAVTGFGGIKAEYDASLRALKRHVQEAWDKGVAGADEQQKYITRDVWQNHATDGSIRWDRAATLASFIQMCRPRHMLEIGSFLGLSSNFILRLMTPWRGEVTSLDPNVRHRVFDNPRDIFNLMNREFRDRVHSVDGFWLQQASMESGKWDYIHREPRKRESEIASILFSRPLVTPKYFKERGITFDAAFIDGAHDYETVRNDFLNVLSVVEPGSCIIFDDVSAKAWPPTYKAFMDIYTEALKSGNGIAFFGNDMAVFVDRGLVEQTRSSRRFTQS